MVDSVVTGIREGPLNESNTKDTYEHFYQKYRALLTYKDFKSEIMQCFREVGNCIIITQLLEEHMVNTS